PGGNAHPSNRHPHGPRTRGEGGPINQMMRISTQKQNTLPPPLQEQMPGGVIATYLTLPAFTDMSGSRQLASAKNIDRAATPLSVSLSTPASVCVCA
ncbi:hypothetical protein NHX12_006222, partial [Muraenolepis orangiensis]